ncbi:MAG: type II toxin-antitoxin system VapC family toxin [Steroidobacter sp.]
MADGIVMIFDTDIFIWVQHGNIKAARLMEKEDQRLLSLQTYLELLQGARNKSQHDRTIDFLKDFEFKVLPLTENIGHRAAVYIEEYAVTHGLRAGDAIIAATAVENNLPLCSSNTKHFKAIKELKLRAFNP